MKMSLVLVLCAVLSGIVSVQCMGDMMIGPGRWVVEDVMTCEDEGQYEMVFEVTREKLNRTHDGFSLYISYDQDLTELVGIEIDMYKMVDGGYKYYQYVSDPSACNFVKKFTEENLKKILTMAGVDPPDCPVPAGEYSVDEFVFNYSELTDPCPYGSYETYSYLTSNDKRIACVKLYTRFERSDDD